MLEQSEEKEREIERNERYGLGTSRRRSVYKQDLKVLNVLRNSNRGIKRYVIQGWTRGWGRKRLGWGTGSL